MEQPISIATQLRSAFQRARGGKMHYLIHGGRLLCAVDSFTPTLPHDWIPGNLVGLTPGGPRPQPGIRFVHLLDPSGCGWGLELDPRSLLPGATDSIRAAVKQRITGDAVGGETLLTMILKAHDGVIPLMAMNHSRENLQELIGYLRNRGVSPMILGSDGRHRDPVPAPEGSQGEG